MRDKDLINNSDDQNLPIIGCADNQMGVCLSMNIIF